MRKRTQHQIMHRTSIFLCVAFAACAADAPVYPTPTGDARSPSGPKYDGIQWVDYGKPTTRVVDWFVVAPKDAGVKDRQPRSDGSQQTADAGTSKPDSSTVKPPDSCPVEGKCMPTCGSLSVCTKADGVSCAKRYTLKGSNSSKAVLLQIAVAYASCFKSSPSSNKICGAFETCGMTGSVTESRVRSWICDSAKASDFPSRSTFRKAQEVVGCEWLQKDRADWKVGSVGPKRRGRICISYRKMTPLWWDLIHIDNCVDSPPS